MYALLPCRLIEILNVARSLGKLSTIFGVPIRYVLGNKVRHLGLALALDSHGLCCAVLGQVGRPGLAGVTGSCVPVDGGAGGYLRQVGLSPRRV
jgi:hypothetical protein